MILALFTLILALHYGAGWWTIVWVLLALAAVIDIAPSMRVR